MKQFIAHDDTPRTFASKKGATAAIKRDLSKHWDAHGDVLFDTGFDVQSSGGAFGIILYCDLTKKSARKLVGPELHGYVIEPQLTEEPVKKSMKPKPTTAIQPDTTEPKKASRRKGQVSVSPTAPLVQCRVASKQQAIIDMLARDNVWDQQFMGPKNPRDSKSEIVHLGNASKVGGATLDELRAVCIKKDGVTPWDDNSIRSALYYDLKDKGYGTSTRFENDVPIYSLVLPLGVDKPLAAKASKS